jgi:hypothetical protein
LGGSPENSSLIEVIVLRFSFLEGASSVALIELVLQGRISSSILCFLPGYSLFVEGFHLIVLIVFFQGFTAGGFIYIAIAGVLPEMHRTGSSAKITFLQLAALGSGMSVALLISLIE